MQRGNEPDHFLEPVCFNLRQRFEALKELLHIISREAGAQRFRIAKMRRQLIGDLFRSPDFGFKENLLGDQRGGGGKPVQHCNRLSNGDLVVVSTKAFDHLQIERLCARSEEHTSELQSHSDLVCRLLLEKKKKDTP